jgi:hypothetical protein
MRHCDFLPTSLPLYSEVGTLVRRDEFGAKQCDLVLDGGFGKHILSVKYGARVHNLTKSARD